MATVTFAFDCGRGYHVYKRSWTPIQGEILSVIHETKNAYDRRAIAVLKQSQIVGHLPKEISRIVRFKIVHGAHISVTVLDEQHRRSPLIQGGLEIPVRVTVSMEHSDINSPNLQKFEELIKQYYKEPDDGKYDDATTEIIKAIGSIGSDSDAGVLTGDDSTDEED